LLQACGGGGGTLADGGGGGTLADGGDAGTLADGGDAGTTNPDLKGFLVVPGLGAFSSGAVVTAINPENGQDLVTAQTNAQGEARLELLNFQSPFVLRVRGASGVIYFNEADGDSAPFGSGESLFALVPAPPDRAVANGVRIGVTPLTHMAAAFAGVDPSNGSLPTLGDGETYQQVMLRAYARVRQALGLLKQSESTVARALNPLRAPRLISSTVSNLDVSLPGAYMGVYLAELAAAAQRVNEVNPLDFAKTMFAVGASLRLEILRTASTPQNFNLANTTYLTNLSPVLSAAAQALTSRSSAFIQPGQNSRFDNDVQNAFVSAVNLVQNPNFTVATRDELSFEISSAILTQLTAAQTAV